MSTPQLPNPFSSRPLQQKGGPQGGADLVRDPLAGLFNAAKKLINGDSRCMPPRSLGWHGFASPPLLCGKVRFPPPFFALPSLHPPFGGNNPFLIFVLGSPPSLVRHYAFVAAFPSFLDRPPPFFCDIAAPAGQENPPPEPNSDSRASCHRLNLEHLLSHHLAFPGIPSPFYPIGRLGALS